MAPCSACFTGVEVGIQVSAPIEVATVMGLAVLIVTFGPVVSLVLLIVLIHSGDVLPMYLHADLHDSESCICLENCCIDCCERSALRILWFGGWCDVLELGVLQVADQLFPVIIIVVRASLVMSGGFATTAA